MEVPDFRAGCALSFPPISISIELQHQHVGHLNANRRPAGSLGESPQALPLQEEHQFTVIWSWKQYKSDLLNNRDSAGTEVQEMLHVQQFIKILPVDPRCKIFKAIIDDIGIQYSRGLI